MKKLSEIGTHCTPHPASYTQYEPYWTFSKEERRELVEQAISAWEGYRWRAAIEEMKQGTFNRADEFKKFLEENGI